MPKLRSLKKIYKAWLSEPDWQSHIKEIKQQGIAAIAPLMALLPNDALIKHRAAVAIGETAAEMAKKDMETAKNICRRFMWHMNEDSGNIGWGIPEAFAETLAKSPELAKQYISILFSYIMDLGHADNYCDHDVLRRSCFWAAGRILEEMPEYSDKIKPWLIKGLNDNDAVCKGMALWALTRAKLDLMDVPILEKLKKDNELIEIYEHDKIVCIKKGNLAENALKKPL